MQRSIDIFSIHAKIMDDYKHFVSSFINIKDERIREVVETEINAGKYWPEPLIQFNPSFEEGESIAELGKVFDGIALQRAEALIDAHERFRKVLGGKRFKVVEPVLPMDVLGVYILLPENQR